MLNKKLIATISDMVGLTEKKTKEIFDATFVAIAVSLEEERRVDVRGFGAFKVHLRNARKARNPRTGETVDMPEIFVLRFKPATHLANKFKQLARKESVDV